MRHTDWILGVDDGEPNVYPFDLDDATEKILQACKEAGLKFVVNDWFSKKYSPNQIKEIDNEPD